MLTRTHAGRAIPGDAYAVMLRFDAEGFAILQVAFAIAGHHLVENQQVTFSIDLDHVALEALVALMKRKGKWVMVLLQET